MHVHLPKPLHGWRAFAGEVGIIVVGVLIALGSEQAVESWHWRVQAAEARTALRDEIGRDDLPQAYTRLAIAPCLSAILDKLNAALAGHPDRSRFLALAQTYRPPNRSWDDEAWRAVISTGVLSHGGAGELIRWSRPYRTIVAIGPLNQAEADDAIELTAMSSAAGVMTSAEADRAAATLHRLVRRAEGMEITSRVLVEEARETGVVMKDSDQRQALAELRPDWGRCVVRPKIGPLDLGTQSDQPVRRSTLNG